MGWIARCGNWCGRVDSLRSRQGLASLALAAVVLLLFGLNVLGSYSAGQHRTMYEHPIYRWRESLAVALSRMRPEPLAGYLAYRSIHDYLVRHGLALMEGEADPLPTREEMKALVRDGARMNVLIEEASRVPIDPDLQPVAPQGIELGLADFYYWAFAMFGLDIGSFVLLYYSLLLIAVLMYFLSFRRSPFAILLLMFFLLIHYQMV